MVDIGSDQTSLHNPWSGGYYPIGYSFEDANKLIYENPEKFKAEVKSTLKKHVEIINKHVKKGTYFFDYGNAFLLKHLKLMQISSKKMVALNIQAMFRTLWGRCVLIMVLGHSDGYARLKTRRFRYYRFDCM